MNIFDCYYDINEFSELSVAQTVHMWGDSALMFSSVLSSVWINSIESSTVRILRAEICLWSQNRTSNPPAARWGSFWNLLAWKSWHRYPPAKPEVCQAPRLIQQQANGLPDWVTTNKTDLKLLNFICTMKGLHTPESLSEYFVCWKYFSDFFFNQAQFDLFFFFFFACE